MCTCSLIFTLSFLLPVVVLSGQAEADGARRSTTPDLDTGWFTAAVNVMLRRSFSSVYIAGVVVVMARVAAYLMVATCEMGLGLSRYGT